jgi:hypothetical protein
MPLAILSGPESKNPSPILAASSMPIDAGSSNWNSLVQEGIADL